MQKGLIFNIQRFSLHDGPGIRTTVFFKGCPLRCAWCQNPEGFDMNSTLFRSGTKCISCRSCEENCPEGALVLKPSGIVIDRAKCKLCFTCAEVCPVEAIQVVGQEITVQDLLAEVLKDRIIFEESGGGVTISGGEPLMQPDFLIALLKALNNENVHTAIETSGCAPWDILESSVVWTDLVYYDLKLLDEEKSKTYLGASGSLIIDNLRNLIKKGANVRVRMPYIPSVNDDPDNLKQVSNFLKSLGVSELELIPYHNLGIEKYSGLDLNSYRFHIEVPASEQLAVAKNILENNGLTIISEV